MNPTTLSQSLCVCGDIDIIVYIRGLGTDTRVSEVSSGLFLLQSAHFHAVTIWVTSCLLEGEFKKNLISKRHYPHSTKNLFEKNLTFALLSLINMKISKACVLTLKTNIQHLHLLNFFENCKNLGLEFILKLMFICGLKFMNSSPFPNIYMSPSTKHLLLTVLFAIQIHVF